jgi:hypothetical protein
LKRRLILDRQHRLERTPDDLLRADAAEQLHAGRVHRQHLARLFEQDDAGGQRFDDQAQARFAAFQLLVLALRLIDGAAALGREPERGRARAGRRDRP